MIQRIMSYKHVPQFLEAQEAETFQSGDLVVM